MLVVTNNFSSNAESAAVDNGVPAIRIVKVPSEFYYKARVSMEQMRPIAAGAINEITAALTRPLTAAEARSTSPDQETKGTIAVTGGDYSEALEKFNSLFLANRWSDGLPLIPPTKEAVTLMLRGTRRAPSEVLGKVAIKNGVATIEKVAINAVMAGAKPEYLPVIIAAMEAMLDKGFDLNHLLASTGSCTPVIQVNGPIAKELNMNSGIGYMGHGWRANSTIGRALRLCTINLGHVWPQANDMGLTGREAAYTNYIFAENEEDSPWKPYHVDLGFKPDESTVTVSSMMWYLRQGPGGAVTTHTPEEQLQILSKIFVDMGYPTSPARAWLWSKRYIVGMDPGLARELARRGYTKEKVKQYLFENARVPYSTLYKNDIRGLRQAVQDGKIPSTLVSPEMLKEGGLIPVVKGPELIHLVVVGGMPGYTAVWCYPGPNFGHVTRKVTGATLTVAGR